ETGDPQPAGSEGLIEAHIPLLGPDWVRTTDLAMIDEDGFLYHRGRSDSVIIRGGHKVHPDRIVSALKLHPAVRDAGVVGIPDRRLGAVPAAAVEVSEGVERPTEIDLIEWVRGEVAATHVPVRVLV